MCVSGGSGVQKIQSLDPELAKTLKANGFLLLYNLVESTMRNAIQAIFDELASSKVSFDSVKTELKIIVLQNLKACAPDKVHLKMSNISLDIITAGFDPERLFSGNVDGRLIRETANKYGFSSETKDKDDETKKPPNNGDKLLIVKTNRNNLAHGIQSFEEVGRNYYIE